MVPVMNPARSLAENTAAAVFYVAGLAHPADGRYRPVTRVFAAVLLAGRAMCRMPGQMPPGHSTFERTPSGPSWHPGC
jgi:hypothetical protein